ncbi:hypothetical protein SAT01_27720 [Sinomonas atrocyanea]|nr:hypothetical protein SAT01_27720 [Sinomonas atrocyanea]GGG59232.1 hypothetical protein GCM10007172_07630 [Sinomonas atrocyanea]
MHETGVGDVRGGGRLGLEHDLVVIARGLAVTGVHHGPSSVDLTVRPWAGVALAQADRDGDGTYEEDGGAQE